MNARLFRQIRTGRVCVELRSNNVDKTCVTTTRTEQIPTLQIHHKSMSLFCTNVNKCIRIPRFRTCNTHYVLHTCPFFMIQVCTELSFSVESLYKGNLCYYCVFMLLLMMFYNVLVRHFVEVFQAAPTRSCRCDRHTFDWRLLSGIDLISAGGHTSTAAVMPLDELEHVVCLKNYKRVPLQTLRHHC